MEERAPRLSEATLPTDITHVHTPAARPVRSGIVHLGLGAFFRAHQAVFTERAFEVTGDDGWGILGVTGQRSAVADTLHPQDGLYSVLERSGGPDRLDVIGSMTAVAAGERDADRVIAAIAAEETKIVTLTITEKSYSTGGALSRPLRTLRDGLAQRRRTHRRPITIISCDNLRDNGAVLRAAMSEIVDSDTRRWMQDAAAFPRTMVDRIVPSTVASDLRRVRNVLGMRDEAAVVAEPFAQWVIADEFATERPAWERAGVVLSDEVSRWEDLKIRTLNATHSLLAYEGILRGHSTIDECVADEGLSEIARGLMRQTARSFVVPSGADLSRYQEQTLERFANPGLGHTVRQIAKDGTEKLPVRLIAPLWDLRERREDLGLVARAVGAWMVCAHVRPDLLDDPRADEVRVAATGARNARELVSSMLGMGAVFDRRIATDSLIVEALHEHVNDLLRSSR